MTKTRKIKVGDFVHYANKEWIVTKKNKIQFRLVRRQVKTGASILVPRKRVKLADQTWRSELQPGDPLEIFIGGQWINAAVYERRGNKLIVQPSLSNFTMSVYEHSGIISKASHSFPLWQKDTITPVVIDGQCQIERAHGLTFPWSYTSESSTRIEVTGPLRTELTTLTFPFYEAKGIPFKMYKNLTKAEIMYDIHANKASHPDILVDIATQWCYCRLPIYPCLRHSYGLRFYITQALAHEDERRVQEMLSVGEHSSTFHKSEWCIRDELSHPYIDAEITFVNKTLQVKIFHSGIKIDSTQERVKNILAYISKPMTYAPKILSTDASPEIQFILSRMLGMETEPVELLSTRKILGSNILMNLERGFCEPELMLCGGQLNIECIDYTILIKELMKRKPMRTLIVVETSALPVWKNFNRYYGKNRKFEPVTVTTKTMFCKIARSQHHFDQTERLFIIADTNWYSSLTHVARNFRCKVKWAVNCPFENRNSRIFHSPHLNDNLTVELSKSKMLEMGVNFPQVTSQEIIFNVYDESVNILIQRLKSIYPNVQREGWRLQMCNELISLYLEHPELIPIQFRGEKLAAVEATLAKISEKFGVEKTLLDSRIQEICSVCLEKIEDASVTPCGHVFCSTCIQELHKRHINCPMCRAKITSFLKLSDKDTAGKIQVHQGEPYRVPETENWGKKIQFIKQHKDAVVVVPSNQKGLSGDGKFGRSIKKKLKKIFRKRQILTTDELLKNQHPLSCEVIILKPSNVQQKIGLPWGKDIKIFELKYKLKNTPFGREFF